MPNPTYMDGQNELNWTAWSVLIDWLIQVQVCFHLILETLFLTVNIIDHFLSTCVISLSQLQLVAVTCLFIASKVEEIEPPSIMHLLHCTDMSLII